FPCRFGFRGYCARWLLGTAPGSQTMNGKVTVVLFFTRLPLRTGTFDFAPSRCRRSFPHSGFGKALSRKQTKRNLPWLLTNGNSNCSPAEKSRVPGKSLSIRSRTKQNVHLQFWAAGFPLQSYPVGMFSFPGQTWGCLLSVGQMRACT